MSLEQDIRAEIENIKKLKMEVGNINNHLSALEGMCRKDKYEAYQKGYDDATKAISSDEQSIADKAYQSGLNDAWEAARKIVCDDSFDWNTLFHIFNSRSFEVIFGNFSASEAVDRMKAYEENKDDEPMPKDEFCFGDEVVDGLGGKGIVVSRNNTDEMIWVLIKGLIVPQKVYKSDCRKTGAHCDIDGYFEEI